MPLWQCRHFTHLLNQQGVCTLTGGRNCCGYTCRTAAQNDYIYRITDWDFTSFFIVHHVKSSLHGIVEKKDRIVKKHSLAV